MNAFKNITKQLRKYGFFSYDVNEIIDVSKLLIEFDNLIKSGEVNVPRRASSHMQSLRNCDLDDYHNLMGGEEGRIDVNQFRKGEQTFRNEVVHVTVKDPLVDLPYLNEFVFNPFVQKIADCYLEGDSAVGYVKVKKSYANGTANRSSNHKFHTDDNAPKILKFLFYLDDVGPGGGAFHYVKGSHLDIHLRYEDRVTFEDHEVMDYFGESEIRELIGPAGTCVIADTLGLHKEGTATIKDRYSVIINYVLEPEYQGSRDKQIIYSDSIEALPEKRRQMARFLSILPAPA